MLQYRKIALDLLFARDKGLCFVCGQSVNKPYARIGYVDNIEDKKNIHLVHKRCLAKSKANKELD